MEEIMVQDQETDSKKQLLAGSTQGSKFDQSPRFQVSFEVKNGKGVMTRDQSNSKVQQVKRGPSFEDTLYENPTPNSKSHTLISGREYFKGGKQHQL